MIRSALTRSAREYPLATTPDPKEKHAAVLIPLCNINDKAGILLELRGKLRTHSGEVRCDDYRTRTSGRNISWAALMLRYYAVFLAFRGDESTL